jgi:hypothetical protein
MQAERAAEPALDTARRLVYVKKEIPAIDSAVSSSVERYASLKSRRGCYHAGSERRTVRWLVAVACTACMRA